MSAQAQAAYEETVAGYQDTVLRALQEVEDNLAALRVLREEADIQARAVAAAERSLTLATNRYRGGVASYLEVIAAQNAALSNQRTAADILSRRLGASVLLIKALGGGWNVVVASRAEGGTERVTQARLRRRCAVVAAAGCRVRLQRARRSRTRMQIEAWHAEKDRFMRESSESPVPADKRATFPPLAYFPDRSGRIAYRRRADAGQGGPTLEMPTSTGQRRKMRRVGTLAFTLEGPAAHARARSSRRTRRTCAGCSCRSAT